MKRAVITGAGGQDGYYMYKLLKARGYEILPIFHNALKLKNWVPNWRECDIANEQEFKPILDNFKPDEIYNFGANSNNLEAFNTPMELLDSNVRPVVTILDYLKYHKKTKFFQASSSLIFGANRNDGNMQYETTVKSPTTPYGASKLYAYNLIQTYKKHYGVFAVNGILFNHESPRRKEYFVIPKIIKRAIEIKNGTAEFLELGDLDIKRDWIHAEDVVKGAYLSLQFKEPRDWVVASGKSNSLRYVVDYVFNRLGLDYEKYVKTNPKFINKKQENNFTGGPYKAKKFLKWAPTHSLEEILDEIIEHYEELLSS